MPPACGAANAVISAAFAKSCAQMTPGPVERASQSADGPGSGAGAGAGAGETCTGANGALAAALVSGAASGTLLVAASALLDWPPPQADRLNEAEPANAMNRLRIARRSGSMRKGSQFTA